MKRILLSSMAVIFLAIIIAPATASAQVSVGIGIGIPGTYGYPPPPPPCGYYGPYGWVPCGYSYAPYYPYYGSVVIGGGWWGPTYYGGHTHYYPGHYRGGYFPGHYPGGYYRPGYGYRGAAPYAGRGYAGGNAAVRGFSGAHAGAHRGGGHR